jgi:hypothetical protein
MFPKTLHANDSNVESFPFSVFPSIAKGEIISTMYLYDHLLGKEVASAY